eukprot:TRINITY_DN191_c0_g1_i1.p1 TRINITY_DN191_c0_g1~~TRINITY_DN191_c0_g1_i1.p1  ORF type:complete len:482 (+),score=78.63 TRINITY_DN191_c0_g1_i1:42-1487(+)
MPPTLLLTLTYLSNAVTGVQRLNTESRLTSMAMSEDGGRMILGTDGAMKLWDLQDSVTTNTTLGSWFDEKPAVAIVPDGSMFATNYSIAGVVLATTSPPAKHFLSMAELCGSAYTMAPAFSPDATLLAVGRCPKSPKFSLYNLSESLDSGDDYSDERYPMNPSSSRTMSSLVNSVAFSPDSERMLLGKVCGMVEEWTVSPLRFVKVVMVHAIKEAESDLADRPVTSAAYAPDGSFIVSTGRDKFVYVKHHLRPLGSAYGREWKGDWYPTTDVSQDGRLIAIGGMYPEVWAWASTDPQGSGSKGGNAVALALPDSHKGERIVGVSFVGSKTVYGASDGGRVWMWSLPADVTDSPVVSPVISPSPAPVTSSPATPAPLTPMPTTVAPEPTTALPDLTVNDSTPEPPVTTVPAVDGGSPSAIAVIVMSVVIVVTCTFGGVVWIMYITQRGHFKKKPVKDDDDVADGGDVPLVPLDCSEENVLAS